MTLVSEDDEYSVESVGDAMQEGSSQEEKKEQEIIVLHTTSLPSTLFGPPKLPVDRDWLQKLLRKHSGSNASSQRNIRAYVLAPMVDQSDLPFRLQCRTYGTNLCFTPMIHAKLFATAPAYRRKFMLMHHDTAASSSLHNDRPLIAQLCGSDLEHMLYTATAVAPYCDAIDINCGCPQSIAKRGLYGAFLLEQEELLLAVVKLLLQHLTIPLTVKVRLLPAPGSSDEGEDDTTTTTPMNAAERQTQQRDASLQRSLALYEKLVDAGIHMLTVHGRTRFHKGVGTGQADWAAVKTVVETFGHRIPILANGSISNQQDVRDCFQQTGADGVMSSEAILEYPPLFQGMIEADERGEGEARRPEPPRIGRLQLALEYLDWAELYPPNVHGQGSGVKCVKVHVHRFLHTDLQEHVDIRKLLVDAESVPDLRHACALLADRHAAMQHDDSSEQLSWYFRHRTISRDCFGVTVNSNSNNTAEEKSALQIRMEQDGAIKCYEITDDAADCFACLFDDE